MPDHKILMTFPSLKDKGGVVNFCRPLKENLDSSFKVDHLTIGNRPGNKSLIRRFLFFFRDFLALKRRLVENKYDVIHLNPSLKMFALLRDSLYLSIISKSNNGKIVVMFHGWDVHLAEKIGRNILFRKYFKKIYENAFVILVLCSHFKEQLVKMGILPERVRVITTMYEGSQLRTRIPDRKTDEKINILFMARFEKSKGVYTVAEVGRILVENGYKNFKLTLAGDGPEFEELRQYIARFELNEYISTPGYVMGEAKWKMLQSNDVFLYPSYYDEGCPIVIIEAMGSGLAVISTPVAAIPEIVKNNENGFIIESKKPQAFCEAVKMLNEDRELLRKMQDLNKRKAEELYEVKVVTKKIEAVYLSAIGEKAIIANSAK